MLYRILATMTALTAMTTAQAVELSDEQRAEIEARLAPVGTVCVEGEPCGGTAAPAATAAPASAAADGAGMAAAAVDGEATYNMACMACHMSGAAGAPIVGNEEQWAPRIAKGMDALYNSGLNGVAGTGMMAKGGRADLSDEAVMAAVDYMVENSGGPAASSAAAAPAAEDATPAEDATASADAAPAAVDAPAEEAAAADSAPVTVAASNVDGEAIYNSACMACHMTGAAGAPIVGNAEQWAPRIAKGIDALYTSGLNGVAGTGMMAKGGRPDLSDEAIKAAVDFMVASSQ